MVSLGRTGGPVLQKPGDALADGQYSTWSAELPAGLSVDFQSIVRLFATLVVAQGRSAAAAMGDLRSWSCLVGGAWTAVLGAVIRQLLTPTFLRQQSASGKSDELLVA